MEFFTLMMERVAAFWRNRQFFHFRKFHHSYVLSSSPAVARRFVDLRHVTQSPDKNFIQCSRRSRNLRAEKRSCLQKKVLRQQ